MAADLPRFLPHLQKVSGRIRKDFLPATAAITIELAAIAGETVGVLSQVPPRGRLKHEVRGELERCGLPVLKSEVGHRMAFRYALQDGALVQDHAPRSKAAAEVAGLWREIAGRLGVQRAQAPAAEGPAG